MVERKGLSRRFPFMMTHRSLTNTLACILGISGFMVALSAGFFSGNGLDSVLERALLSALVCFLAGGGIGMLLDGVLERHAQKLRIEQVSDDEQNQNDTPADSSVSSPQVVSKSQAVA
jgi:hypothetical protein